MSLERVLTLDKNDNFGKVKMDNDSYANVIRIDDICLWTDVDASWQLKNVRYVSGMLLNLLSMHAFDVAGYESFGNREWKLTKGLIGFARGKIYHTLY